VRAFDTNLLVRILTRDDAGQAEVIDRLMAPHRPLDTASHYRAARPSRRCAAPRGTGKIIGVARR
jgi:hypothetical protein